MSTTIHRFADGAWRPSLLRRLAALVYETVLVLSWIFLGMVLPAIVWGSQLGQAPPGGLELLWSLALVVFYFLWQWLRGGQTLAMKSWRLRLTTREGHPLSWRQALTRLTLTLCCLAPLGLGWWWALADREGLFLHDRLSKTRLVLLPPR